MVRYRILRDLSSRDGDAMIAPVLVRGEPWICGCGTTNTDDWGNCLYCNTQRGDWVCDCGRKNRKADEECSECGTAKPDDE